MVRNSFLFRKFAHETLRNDIFSTDNMNDDPIRQLIQDIEAPSAILRGERDGFLLSLMVLSTYTIQADIVIAQAEMNFMHGFLLQHFGDKLHKCESLMFQLFAEAKKYPAEVWRAKVRDCACSLAVRLGVEERQLLVAFLIRITRADNIVTASEVRTVAEVAEWLGVNYETAMDIDLLRKEAVTSWKY